MEATGYAQWFERMLAEQGHELWIGHASEIRAGVVRKQKTDARDAAHLLRLLTENRFPRIWIPSPAERDARQLLRHRYKLVCFRVSEEPVARAGDEPGDLSKEEVVHGEGA
jgi:transposase